MFKTHKSICAAVFCLALTLVFASCGKKKGQEEFEKGMEAFAAKDYKTAMTQFESAAGDTYAMRRLGRCYLRGRGVKEDTNEYVKWIRKAADSGDEAAMFEMGDIYFSGHYLYYEKPQDFCHRHLVSDWMRSVGINIEEFV